MTETDVHASIIGRWNMNYIILWFSNSLSHLFSDDESIQNSNTVIAIVRSSRILFKKAHPEVTALHIRMDNAGEKSYFL